mmetsp:Transcript_39313/g.77512  ORF Transcript_39313/g.77512 Transcript_39313/m.77512 type:complete len:221 (+) Transcript_39313:1336-1998(+)
MRRPSSMPSTMAEKSSESKIMSAASLETSVPAMPMAHPMSACDKAGESFTPSPVTATMWPIFCAALTMRSFWVGLVRANTTSLYSITCWISASDMLSKSVPAHTIASEMAAASCCEIPLSSIRSWMGGVFMMFTVLAMAAAVMGWSPVTITTFTPARCAESTELGTASRGGSMRAMRPMYTRLSEVSARPLSLHSVPRGKLAASGLPPIQLLGDSSLPSP